MTAGEWGHSVESDSCFTRFRDRTCHSRKETSNYGKGAAFLLVYSNMLSPVWICMTDLIRPSEGEGPLGSASIRNEAGEPGPKAAATKADGLIPNWDPYR
jgi:hypothetical protein